MDCTPNSPINSQKKMDVTKKSTDLKRPAQIQTGSPVHKYFIKEVEPSCGNQSALGLENVSNRSQCQPIPSRHNESYQNDSTEDTNDNKFSSYMSKEEVEVRLQNDNTLVEGVLKINPRNYKNAYVSGADRRCKQDIFINSVKNRNRALEGDIVIAYVDSVINKQKRGKVVYIKVKVHNRMCIGVLKQMPDKNRQTAQFIPRDRRVPRLNIPCEQCPDDFYDNSEKYKNILFLAKIEDWSDISFAMGKIVCELGQSDDIQSENLGIIAETDLDITSFGSDVQHLYPRLDYTIPEEEYKLREDCRKICTFCIDSPKCTEPEDALSCQKLRNGNYEVGVHISDVAHFLSENTKLDEKVAKKASTIFFIQTAYNMLPDDLSKLCSFSPGEDKLAFSVLWEMTEDAIIIKNRIAKSIINSCSQLTYYNAQAVLANYKHAEIRFPQIYNGFSYRGIREAIKVLGRLSAILRNRRYQDGALRMDGPSKNIYINGTTGLPESLRIAENRKSHELVEEFMLLANMTVAKRIHDDHPKRAILRCHPSPNIYRLKELARSLEPIGIHLEFQSAGALNKSLLPYIGPQNKDPGRAMVLKMLCAKTFKRSMYICTGGSMVNDYQHYSLNTPLYTHFTSPIRRYADIMVHRLLAASINYTDSPKWEINKICEIVDHCNKQKYNAKKALNLFKDMLTNKYIILNSPLVKKAVVVELHEMYIDVCVTDLCLYTTIYLNDVFPGEYKFIKNYAREKLSKMELTWMATINLPFTKQIIKAFSVIKVEMVKCEDDDMQFETKLVRPNETY